MKLKIALIVASATAVLAAAVSGYADEARGDKDHHDDDSSDAVRARIGFENAPVPLNLKGRDRFLVGLGSYFVNIAGDCNGCHSAGPPTEYAKGGNPYFKGNPPQVVNQATYLGGGRIFAPLLPGTPSIVSRNLTPDHTGRPEGGRTFAEFRLIMRTGVDLDHVHPNCSDPKVLASTTCYPVKQPFNGDLLQVMPWTSFKYMTDRDLRAVYEYLSAIPCLEGSEDETSVVHNDCT